MKVLCFGTCSEVFSDTSNEENPKLFISVRSNTLSMKTYWIFRIALLIFAVGSSISGRILYNTYRTCRYGPNRDNGDEYCPTGILEVWYLTIWTSYFVILYSIFSIIVLMRTDSNNLCDKGLTGLMRIQWYLRTFAIDYSFLVTVLYWGLLAGGTEETKYPGWEKFVNVSDHGINFIFMLVDMYLSPIPHRLPHISRSFGVAILYLLVTLFINGVGKVKNSDGNTWIYKKTIDWRSETVLTIINVVVVGIIVLPLFHYLTSKLASYIDKKYGQLDEDRLMSDDVELQK